MQLVTTLHFLLIPSSNGVLVFEECFVANSRAHCNLLHFHLLTARAFIKSISEQDYCQIGMTAIVMGDVNAVYTLECAHRSPCSCTERTFPASQWTPPPRSSAGRCLARLPSTANKCRQVRHYTLGKFFGEDASMASQAHSSSLFNAEFRSCSSRC